VIPKEKNRTSQMMILLRKSWITFKKSYACSLNLRKLQILNLATLAPLKREASRTRINLEEILYLLK
jgi:hypothetical protein